MTTTRSTESATAFTPPGPERNLLLAMIAANHPEVHKQLVGRLESTKLELEKVLYDVDVPISHVYFPEDGLASIVRIMRDGRTVEVGTVGREGMTGVPVFLGASHAAGRCFVQVRGAGKRIEADVFRELIAADGPLRALTMRYALYFYDQVAQSVACNRLHSIEQRCARWLLMSADRVGSDEFDLTQRFLAFMLGVRRPGVTVAEGILRDAGLITYHRGRVTILDRAGLEATACECYGVDRADYDRLLGDGQ